MSKPPVAPSGCAASDPSRQSVGSPVGLSVLNSTQSQATSPGFLVPNNSAGYCWMATYTPGSGDLLRGYTSLTHTNTTTECFTVSAPTAVTLTDFSARTSDGRGVAVIGFGTLGFVLLGGLSFVFARKRQVTTLDKGRPVPEAG